MAIIEPGPPLVEGILGPRGGLWKADTIGCCENEKRLLLLRPFPFPAFLLLLLLL